MEPRHYDALLVGGGVAAARCARVLRRGGFAGSIALVGEEPLPPYNRPPLSKELLREDLPVELVLAEQPSWYERRGVELLLGTPVASLDPTLHSVELADGRRLRYGACLLATGAEALQPPVPGAQHALPLRSYSEAQAIAARAAPGARAVVVGGGFIGVEVAASLAARGMQVTVLELGPALWGGLLGRSVGTWAAHRLSTIGVAVRLETACTGIGLDSVHAGSTRLPADLVVAGVGVRPRTGLAESAGLEVEDGVVVDEAQATSVPAVMSAGDVARYRDGQRVEHWHAARETGERAALAILGAPLPARRAPWVFSEFGEAHLDVVGSTAGEEEEAELAPGVIGWVRDGRLTQVAILDHALPVEDVRAVVERGGHAWDLP